MDQSRRKSGVSSYYGNNTTEAWSPSADDDLHSPGYNGSSYGAAGRQGRQEPLRGGRDEEEGAPPQEEAWDVYADFNNAGPRYSTVPFGTGTGYRQIPTPDGKADESGIGQVEMVTVPTLGAEWKASEMRDMTKAGKREKQKEEVSKKWKGWHRGETGCCGGWLTRKVLVFILFAFAIVAGITLAFTIPRVPGLNFNTFEPLQPATGTFNSSVPTEFSRAPANFSFPAFASIQVDTSSNYLPLTITQMTAQVFDSDTGYQVATSILEHQTFAAKTFSNLNLPLNFSYVAENSSDITWTNWYDACKNKALITGGVRPGVNFRLDIFMKIAGLT
ncbi:hypothetical protein HWV62_33199, partial [Athelia sp. TMB]